MVRRPSPLPQGLLSVDAFSVTEALAAGAAPSRLRQPDLQRPFTGIRAVAPLASIEQRAAAFALRMPQEWFFSHVTAADLHGLWLPHGRPGTLEPLDVSVFEPGRQPRTKGIRGHELARRGQHVIDVGGLPVLAMAETWGQLAPVMTVDDLVVLADSVLAARPESAVTAMRALGAAASVPGRRDASKLRAALELSRTRVRSAQESRLRLLIVRSGRPEPKVNFIVEDRNGSFVAEIDLAYPRYRVGLEYEGDGHRTDEQQFARDIFRREELLDVVDWWIVRVTKADLHERPQRTLLRLDRAIRRREEGGH